MIKIELINIAKPDIGDEEKKAVMEVLDSGMLVQGKKVEELESMFAGYIGTKYAIATSSGTSALHLAYLSCGLVGSNVVTTPFTFNSTINMLKASGCTIDYTDIRKDTFNMQETNIVDELTIDTQAIIPVHLFGCPANIRDICSTAKENGSIVIEDTAQSLGAEVNGRKLGSFGICGCFSLYPTKCITSAEGGMVTTDSSEIANKIKELRNHSLKSNTIGYNYRMTNIEAAIGIEQLKKARKFLKRRKDIGNLYNDSFKGLFSVPDNENHIFNNYSFLLKNWIKRDSFVAKMRYNNIDCRVYYPYTFSEKPNALDVSSRIVSIPIRPNLSDKEVDYIIDNVKKILIKERHI